MLEDERDDILLRTIVLMETIVLAIMIVNVDDTISSSLCTQADYNLSSFQALKKITDKRQFIVCRLYDNSQTIFDTVPEFDYDRIVTREEASRMITKFVQEVLKKDKIRKSHDPLCQFRDLKLANP